MIPSDYDPIVIWIALGITIPFLVKLINWLLSPNVETPRPGKTIYECGEKPIGEAQRQYNFQFFTFAIVFVVFDVLSVFILTFALIFRNDALDLKMIEIFGIISVFTLLPVIGLVFWLIKNEILWS
ncbi:MAG: NADH-quinone oxidoreductase subunit A [Candidatus Thorarchaeota archaeon]